MQGLRPWVHAWAMGSWVGADLAPQPKSRGEWEAGGVAAAAAVAVGLTCCGVFAEEHAGLSVHVVQDPLQEL